MNYQTTDNDLQKAIDDITNDVNQITANDAPVFSDPVASPAENNLNSFVPNNDLSSAAQTPTISNFANSSEQTAPEQTIPEPTLNFEAQEPTTAEPDLTTVVEPTLTQIDETTQTVEPTQIAEPTIEPEQIAEPAQITEPTTEPAPTETKPFMENLEKDLGVEEIRESALRALAPILNKLDISPEEKFRICKDIFEKYNDSSVLNSAYQSAISIADEKERGEALLYVIELTDKI